MVACGCAPIDSGAPGDDGDSGQPPAAENVQISLTQVASGFTSPVGFVSVPDGSGRMCVVDQVGTVSVLSASGELLAEPFLAISDRMVPLSPAYDERGLLSLAFHPDFAASGRFFVSYSAPLRTDDPANFNSLLRVSEFRVRADNGERADDGSEVVLLEIPEPQSNHNGGQLAFGPDRMLYVTVGDGGSAGDLGTGHTAGIGNGQDPTNLLGTILRFDADTPGQLNIPPDNPFVDDAGVRDEIFAYGFRNPWRCSFDAGGEGLMFCGDVGQNLFEEIDIVQAGGNYGWNIKEGSSCFDSGNANPGAPGPADCTAEGAGGEPLIDPILEYSHSGGSRSGLAVVGGYVYRGTGSPELVGKYIFGDWSDSFVAPRGAVFVAESRRAGTAGQWSFVEADITPADEGRLDRYVLGFGQDQGGEVYLLTTRNLGPTGTSGEVWRVSSP